MPDFPPPRVVWSGRLTDGPDAPLMQVVEDKWGQHLEQAEPAPAETKEPLPETIGRKSESTKRQVALFDAACEPTQKPAWIVRGSGALVDPDDI